MAQGRIGSKIQKKLSFLLYGDHGCWKSTLCSESIALKDENGEPLRVLVIDSEFGGMDQALEMVSEKHDVDLGNVYVVYTESYKEIMDILDKVRKKEDLYYYEEDGSESDEVVMDAEGKPFRPNMIILDGSTVVYNASQIALTRFSEKRAKVKAKAKGLDSESTFVAVGNAGLELKDYNKLNKERSQELVLKLISTGCHHIITAREADEKVSVKTDDGKVQSVATGKKIPEGFKALSYNVSTVVRLFKDDFGQVKGYIDNKDRTRTFEPNAIIDEPSLLMWQGYINKNAGLKTVNLKPTFSEAIDREYEEELAANSMTHESGDKELTVSEYHATIKAQLESLKPEVKKAAANKIKASGLTLKYTEITDINDLKKFMEIISK